MTRDRQRDEAAALAAILGDELVVVTADEPDQPLRLTLYIVPPTELSDVALTVECPDGYPGNARPRISFTASHLPWEVEEEVTTQLSEFLRNFPDDEEVLYQAVEQAKEHYEAAKKVNVSDFEKSLEEATAEEARKWDNGDEGDDDDDNNLAEAAGLEEFRRMEMERVGPPVLGRRICYSHHIRALSKRQAIIQWAVEMRLCGVSRIGYPGVVVVEGEEWLCELYVRRLQRLRWKYFVCRGEQTVRGSLGQNIDDLRRLPRGFLEIGPGGNSMSEVARICEQAGLRDLFLMCWGMYRKQQAGGNRSGGDNDAADEGGCSQKASSSSAGAGAGGAKKRR